MDLLLGISLSTLLGLGPMMIYAFILTWFDRYEREPFWLMTVVFLWGAIVAAGSAFILNTLFGTALLAFTNDELLANVGTAVISAPIVEEAVKGLAVLAVFLFVRHEFDSLMDGIVYGSLVGFGFAATENVNYIFFSGFAEGGLGGAVMVTLVRAVGIAFLHASLSACVGLGVAYFRLSRGGARYLAPFIGYGAAVGFHAAHNFLASLGEPLLCLLGLALDWTGFLVLFAFILYLMWRESHIMRDYLRDEVARGLITLQQYQTAQSLIGQFAARWGTLVGGRWQQTGRFYDSLGELAFKKYHLARRGAAKEPQTPALIEQLRQQIAKLRTGV
ncbi:MAG: PrsW family intramembrane metalloprotease [Anaerolineales bacterium]|nr:PrsW family intramembrane metalloprotease [Anaerolineales bacterium]